MDFSFDSSSSSDSGDGGGSDGGSGGGYDSGSSGGYDSSSTDGGSGASSYYGDEAGNADTGQAASSAYTGDDAPGTHDSTELPGTELSEPAADPAPVTDPAPMDCPPVPTVSDPNALAAVPDPAASATPDTGGPLGVTEPAPAGDSGFVPSGAAEPAPALVPDAGAGQQGAVDVTEPAYTGDTPQGEVAPGISRGVLDPQVEHPIQQTGWRVEMAPDGHGGQAEVLRPPENPADENVYRGQLIQAVHALQTAIAQQQGLPAPAPLAPSVVLPAPAPVAPGVVLPAPAASQEITGAPPHVSLPYIPQQIGTQQGLPVDYAANPANQAFLVPYGAGLMNSIGSVSGAITNTPSMASMLR